MSNYLIASDLHLTDNPLEDYRWKIFDVLSSTAFENAVTDIFILGDVWDRKDRHTGALIQRSIFSLMRLQESTDAQVWVLSGNHDQPINGPYFWNILNYIETADYLTRYLKYLTKPEVYHNICLLPFSSNPIYDWEEFFEGNSGFKCMFMHQTGQGAIVENGRELTSNNLPPLPDIPIFSGDVHRPQTVSGITYVGAPYPIKFSETWDNRVILIEDADFKNFKSIPVNIMKRAIIDIDSIQQLDSIKLNKDDQVRIRYKLLGSKLSNWPLEEEAIRKWSKEKGINLVSLEATFEGDGLKPKEQTNQIEMLPPEEIIKMFCKDEKLDDKILEVGINLVKESK